MTAGLRATRHCTLRPDRRSALVATRQARWSSKHPPNASRQDSSSAWEQALRRNGVTEAVAERRRGATSPGTGSARQPDCQWRGSSIALDEPIDRRRSPRVFNLRALLEAE